MIRRASVRILSEHDIARCVVEVSSIAKDVGFNNSDASKIGTVTSELAYNILKYAGRGEIRINQLGEDHPKGIEIVASDRGPGIENIEQAMQDHYSSSGTLGLGLPGVRRMMDELHIDSTPGKGTRVSVKKLLASPRPGFRRRMIRSNLTASPIASPRVEPGNRDLTPEPKAKHSGSPEPEADYPFDCGWFVRPCRGERVSGDAAIVIKDGRGVFIGLIDALGHGRDANQVARVAKSFLQSNWTMDVCSVMNRLHRHLQGSIGAAAAVCAIQRDDGLVRYAAVGNTAARVFGQDTTNIHSKPGNLGTSIRMIREQQMSLNPNDVLLLHTDGVSERFKDSEFPQLRYADAMSIARGIVNRFGKNHDDAGCIAVRYLK